MDSAGPASGRRLPGTGAKSRRLRVVIARELISALKRAARACVVVSLGALLSVCSRPPEKQSPPTPLVVLLWMLGDSYKVDQRLARQFTEKTGIPVRLLPGSESVSDRLSQELGILERSSSAVDVFQIDTIWPAIVEKHMVDLSGAFGGSLDDQLPDVVKNATIGGRLIAAPFFVDYGMLYYRSDLIRKYGFSHPPRTWDELETQSKTIQAGERNHGHPDFWGYIWQGADNEGLTCNALEWQYSQGGGNFIKPDHTVNVENRASIAAFRRAARWVGTISPPGVTSYMEEDSRNLWQAGKAAFLRNWSYVYPLATNAPDLAGRFRVAPLPSGVNSHSSALGGWYLGVSKYSHRQAAAIAFVKFMTGREAQRQRAIEAAFLPSIASLYSDPDVLRANSFLAALSDMPDHIVSRPASIAGSHYDALSRAYAGGVHGILTGATSAEKGVAQMSADLVRLSGFQAAGTSGERK